MSKNEIKLETEIQKTKRARIWERILDKHLPRLTLIVITFLISIFLMITFLIR